MEWNNPEEYFADTHNNIVKYLNVISYQDMLKLFVLLDEKASVYVLTDYEEKAYECIQHSLCFRFNKCIDWEKDDPFEDFRPSI
tara:strand:- start:1835 stop:2086 length:252 start_codon:yes stop_codon:yes gene_type:complete